MLLHLFEMQDRQEVHSAWTSLCLGQQADENSDLRGALAHLRRHSSSPLHCNTIVPTATTAFSHKHHELDVACNETNPNELSPRHLNCALRHFQPQSACSARTKSNRPPSIRRSELTVFTPSGSQTTRSEPATRSNSIDCEDDMSKLPVVNKVSHDVELPKLSDLIVPNSKLKGDRISQSLLLNFLLILYGNL